MSGRRERQKQDREARILRVAAQLFAAKGYAGTSLQQIAERAHLAVGTIYNYFPSKPEIILAVVEGDTAAGLRAGEQVLKRPPSDPVKAVQVLLEKVIAPFAAHDRALWRELVGAALSDRVIGGGFFASDVRVIALLAALLRELQARGDVRADLDADRAAVALYGVFFAWFMAYLASDALTLDTVRAELRTGVRLVMHGLLERAPNEGEETS